MAAALLAPMAPALASSVAARLPRALPLLLVVGVLLVPLVLLRAGCARRRSWPGSWAAPAAAADSSAVAAGGEAV